MVVENSFRNIARWIILYALCVDIRLLLSLRHFMHCHDTVIIIDDLRILVNISIIIIKSNQNQIRFIYYFCIFVKIFYYHYLLPVFGEIKLCVETSAKRRCKR